MTETPSPESPMATPIKPAYNVLKDWKFYILASFVAFGIILWIYILINGPNIPKRSDADLFKEYFASILSKGDAIDEAYRPFGEALAGNDVLTTISKAKEARDIVSNRWSELNSVSVPDLANKDALKSLRDGHERMSFGYLQKVKVIEGYLSFAEKPSLSAAADVKSAAEKVTPMLVAGLAKYYEVGGKLGVSLEELGKLSKASTSK